MEVRTGVGEADRLAILLHVGEDQDVGVLGMMELIDDVRLGRTEASSERNELRGRQSLVRNRQNLTVEKSILDVSERFVGQRFGEIDPRGLQPEARQQGCAGKDVVAEAVKNVSCVGHAL